MLDAVFIARAFILAWYVNNMNVLKVVGVAAWLFPSLEGSVFVAGEFGRKRRYSGDMLIMGILRSYCWDVEGALYWS